MEELNGPSVLSKSQRADILEYWGSVFRCMRSLFQAITGGDDWTIFADPLTGAGYHYYLLFMFYIAFITFSVLNVLTLVCLKRRLKHLAFWCFGGTILNIS